MQDKIIHFLRSATGYLSGEDISRQLNISRSAIWKYMEELRKEGYEIIAVPHLGYKLLSSPDKLYPREIQHQLTTKTIGQRIVYSETIPSTMDEAFQLALQGAEEGTVVIAESQMKGRGRLGRHWTSPKGKGIYMSLILRPALLPTDIAKITLMGAVAVNDAISSLISIKPRIK